MADAAEQILIAGAGPAGLTAGYELLKHGYRGIIVESDSVVGGLARTVQREGYRFDIGGHRFFTKVKEIERLWDEMLGEPMLIRPRLSRIYYDGKFYDYPLRAGNALKNMGLVTAAVCMASYGKARLWPMKDPQSYEQWVINQFGQRLYRMFFKSYTEKVWGIPCSEIGADWAAQRIKGLSLWEAARNAIFGQRNGTVVKTLIDEFRYPRHGPGQLWEACTEKLIKGGWDVRMDTRVVGARREGNRIASVKIETKGGGVEEIKVGQMFSSIPLRELIGGMDPAAPAEVAEAARKLSYRDFLVVALIVDKAELFADNWIYIHSSTVRVGRIQNFKNWSPEMVPDRSKTCLGMEYFVNEGDDLWSSSDEALVKLAYEELQRIGLAGGPLIKGFVVRVKKAYPVYDQGYKQRIGVIRDWLGGIENLQCIGRNGQHRYNNQDHSMATALIAARNVAEHSDRDPWAVNEDAEYHEIDRSGREAPVTR